MYELRQECSNSLVLFNRYIYILLPYWRDGVLPFNTSAQRNSFSSYLTRATAFIQEHGLGNRATCSDLEFADDAGLVTTWHASAQLTLELFHSVISSLFGLSVNFAETKFIVAGVEASADDRADLISDPPVQCVISFVYLGCSISSDAQHHGGGGG